VTEALSIVRVAVVVAEMDGRRARREQNRLAVLEALGELYRQGNYQPSSAEIAERAGLSPRSLFRYFDDIDDLNRAAIEHQVAQAQPLLRLDVDPGLGTEQKAWELAEARTRLYEAIAPAARAARVSAHSHPVLAAQVSQARTFFRRQLRKLFDSELAAMHPERAPGVLAAVDVLCSFESYELLRHDQRLSRARFVVTISQALCDLLDPEERGRR
jgi:AcrR family transcriptional regulator